MTSREIDLGSSKFLRGNQHCPILVMYFAKNICGEDTRKRFPKRLNGRFEWPLCVIAS